MTRFCAGEDSWLARSNNTASETDPSEAKNSTSKIRRNRHRRRSNDNNTDDATINAGFTGSMSGQRKKPYKRNNEGPSSLDLILDRPCQIQGTPDKQANHTNRVCSVFKQAGKLKRDHKVRTRTRSPGSRTLGGRRNLPLKLKR